jgi:glycosyltransferase involved in cell wall biosynthesis
MDTMNTTAILALAGSGVPLIAAERTDPASGSIERLRDWLRNRMYRHAIIVVQTRRVAKYFAKIGIEANVIANPVTIPDVTAEPYRAGSDSQFCIVACGRLSREKRIPLLIEAFARLASKYPEWYVLLLGDGPEREAIASLVNMRGLRQRVVLAGAVADAQSAMAACHIFAFTSAYEGFPNALAEAMAAVGLPSLACCGVSGVEDLVLDQRTGLLAGLEPSVEDLAAKLETLMGDRSLRQWLGNAARGHVINWSPDVILSKWSYLLEQVCATNNGPAVQKNAGPHA